MAGLERLLSGSYRGAPTTSSWGYRGDEHEASSTGFYVLSGCRSGGRSTLWRRIRGCLRRSSSRWGGRSLGSSKPREATIAGAMAKLPKKPAMPETDHRFAQMFLQESDRAAAVLGGSFLEAVLEEALRSWLRPDGAALDGYFDARQHGFLGTFSAKKNLAYAMGLVSKVQGTSLQTVASIRNFFAHHVLDATFSNAAVREELERVWGGHFSLATPRELYLLLVEQLVGVLRGQTLPAATNERFEQDAAAFGESRVIGWSSKCPNKKCPGLLRQQPRSAAEWKCARCGYVLVGFTWEEYENRRRGG